MRVLVTGGAGFIGSHVADELLVRGHDVVALDSLDRQVHPAGQRPTYLDPRVELCVGDTGDRHTLRFCLRDTDAVIHLAARVGVRQALDEPASYCDTNITSTGVLLEALPPQIRKVVVASSMSVYGEGRRYRGVRESDRTLPTSIYGLTKLAQERMAVLYGAQKDVPVTALRYFNVYGPRQALRNPHTGVAAIFATNILEGVRPKVFEDGKQTRDFVHVRDVARVTVDALEIKRTTTSPINIGTGIPTTLKEFCELLCEGFSFTAGPEIMDIAREGDVRHCYADTNFAQAMLGFSPTVKLRDGLRELCREWRDGEGA